MTPRRLEKEAAAKEIVELVARILALAPTAGLYIGIKISPAKVQP